MIQHVTHQLYPSLSCPISTYLTSQGGQVLLEVLLAILRRPVADPGALPLARFRAHRPEEAESLVFGQSLEVWSVWFELFGILMYFDVF